MIIHVYTWVYVYHASRGALRGPTFKKSVAAVLRSFDPQLVASASKKSENILVSQRKNCVFL